MTKFEVKNRWTGAVQFTAQLDCSEDAPPCVKIGIAVKWAYSSGADLHDADLRGADLRGADLHDAVLCGAVLHDADGKEYYVDGGISIIDAGTPNHWFAFGYVDRDTQALRVHVGCRRFELSEGRAYWSSDRHHNRENRREVLAALDYIEAVAKLRGWKA